MTVKRARQRQRKERTVETRFVLWSLRRYTVMVSNLNKDDGNRTAYHGHESNSQVCKTQNCNADATSQYGMARPQVDFQRPEG